MIPKRIQRRWQLITAGHVPFITNGWSLAQVAAYERRYFWQNFQAR